MTRLGQTLSAYQQKFDVESKVLAREIGIVESTLCRIKQGKMPDAHGLAKIIVWLTKTMTPTTTIAEAAEVMAAEGSKALQREPLRIRLTFDDGLAPYLRALVACPYGIFGGERETIIYLVRSGIIELFKSPAYREAMMPYLPEDIQQAWKRNP